VLLAATTIATIDQPSTSCRRLAIVGENLNMMMLVVRCTIDVSLTFFCLIALANAHLVKRSDFLISLVCKQNLFCFPPRSMRIANPFGEV
jgi:hypothetical protein